MIATMRGIVTEKNPTTAILEIAGIGYEMSITVSTYERLPPVGQEARLFVHHAVSEDDERLFGFASMEEKRLFLLLVTVNGIGPKVAITVLSGISAGELCAAIADRNLKRICAIKGIGKKLAERIVVDLHDKISPADALAGSTAGKTAKDASAAKDALLALGTLGFPPDTARKMIDAAIAAGADTSSADQLVRHAISHK
jgi:Holliday junction DNA helicase RuvA